MIERWWSLLPALAAMTACGAPPQHVSAVVIEASLGEPMANFRIELTSLDSNSKAPVTLVTDARGRFAAEVHRARLFGSKLAQGQLPTGRWQLVSQNRDDPRRLAHRQLELWIPESGAGGELGQIQGRDDERVSAAFRSLCDDPASAASTAELLVFKKDGRGAWRHSYGLRDALVSKLHEQTRERPLDEQEWDLVGDLERARQDFAALKQPELRPVAVSSRFAPPWAAAVCIEETHRKVGDYWKSLLPGDAGSGAEVRATQVGALTLRGEKRGGAYETTWKARLIRLHDGTVSTTSVTGDPPNSVKTGDGYGDPTGALARWLVTGVWPVSAGAR